MGTYAANNITTWFSGYDMTGDLNSTTLDMSYDALDVTAFQPGTVTNPCRSRIAGLETAQLDEQGWWQAGSGQVDPTVFTALGGATQVITNSPDGLESSVAYMYRARQFNYELFGQLGEAAPFRLSAQSARGTGLAAHGAIRGRVLKAKGVVSGTGGMGSVVQVGAVGAGQYLYAALHVFSAGTTISMDLASDDNALFTSGTTRGSIGPVTTTGGTWMTRVAGPITDDYWLFNVTACTGSFTLAAVAGIR